ncbi:MAG: regulatory protein RecX [Burkholderiaceae bacterium]
MRPSRAPSLKARALQALALREQSRAELRRKLLRIKSGSGEGAAAVDPAEVDRLLDELEAQGLLSKDRFIESRVQARAARFGNRRIQAELGQHGLALDAETAAELRRTEHARARAVWARKFGDTPALDGADRARQMRFLTARGFSADVIKRVVKGGDAGD